MDRMKKFFIYFILVILFFIFSRIVIIASTELTYEYKSYEIKTQIPVIAEVQATSVSGIAKGKVINNTDTAIQNKWLKIDSYSKNNVLLGTKYIEIKNINSKENFEYEVRFNYKRINRVEIDIVDEISIDVPEEDKMSDKEMSTAMIIGALFILCIM